MALLCAGCADLSDPLQTFYTPDYQNQVGPIHAYSGSPLPPATADPPMEYVLTISVEQSNSFNSMGSLFDGDRFILTNDNGRGQMVAPDDIFRHAEMKVYKYSLYADEMV